MAEEDKKISKFSSGINILRRIDNLWTNCHNFKRSGQYRLWNEELDSIFLELARDSKPEEYYDIDEDGKLIEDYGKSKKKVITEGLRTQFKTFDEELTKLMPFNDNGNIGFQLPTKEDIIRRNKQYRLLMEKQVFLARLENELGKGTSWEDEDDDF